MLNSYIALVATFFNTENNSRVFLSASPNEYACLRIPITDDARNLKEYISDYIASVTLVDQPETIWSSLITAKKTELGELDLVYTVSLPLNTVLKSDTVLLCSSNLAIIDPYVRKALQYA